MKLIHSLLTVLFSALFLTLAAAPAQTTAWAYVDPAGQGATWTVPGGQYYNPQGSLVTVTRVAGNEFLVDFGAIQAPTNGIVHACAAQGNHRAVVVGWLNMATSVQARVRTFAPSGAAANDEAFTIRFRRGGDPALRQAYLWANEPTQSSYTPSASYAWNGNRPSPTIDRTSLGSYRVTLPGLDPLSIYQKGHVQVTPYGPSLHHCRAAWASNGIDMIVYVDCYDENGQQRDGRFVLSYNETAAPVDPFYGSGGHVWASEPTTNAYMPESDWTDSNGRVGPSGMERIYRITTGSYRVHLPDLAPNLTSTAQVSPYNAANNATVSAWSSDGCGGTNVGVQVFDSNGNPVDGRFSLLYLTNKPAAKRTVAFAWVDPSGQGATFTPSPAYQYSTSGEPITVQRDPLLQHKFTVRVPGVTQYGVVHATAYGGNHTAVVESWLLINGLLHATIALYTPSGAPANDAAFTFHYRRGGNDRTRESYFWAHLPLQLGTYNPQPDYSWNGDRPAPTISRFQTGVYQITIPELFALGVERGSAQVTPYGDSMHRAKLVSLDQVGIDTVAQVRCYDANGQLTNGRFVFSYNETAAPIDVEDGSGAHAQATANLFNIYSLIPEHTDSNGTFGPSNSESIQRLSPGVYSVTLPNLAQSGGNAQVTATGPGATYASVQSWGAQSTGTAVRVHTYDASGVLADGFFTLQFLSNRSATGWVPASESTYGSGCYGMQLETRTLPMLCNDWELSVTGQPPGTLIGFIQADAAQVSLPLGANAPGCSVLTGGAVTNVFLLPATGVHARIAIPASPTLIGVSLFAQGGAYAPGLNPINLAFTGGVEGTIGDI